MTSAECASPSQAKRISGASDSYMTLKLVDTIARCLMRIAGLHEPPDGTSVDVTAVNPATTTAIVANAMSNASPGIAGC